MPRTEQTDSAAVGPESDLYHPVKQYLLSQGYDVKGEIGPCDVLAVRAGMEVPVIVELKRSLNLAVILQAVDRLAISETVYLGVPASCALLRKQRRRVLKLLRMLGLGLLAVDLGRNPARVQAVLDPGQYRPRQAKQRKARLLREFEQRVGDPNPGGSGSRRGVMTAYRQRALAIGRFLGESGPTKAAAVALALDEPRARLILYRNVYDWFERVSVGVYTLSPRGEREIVLWTARSEAADDG